MKKAYLNRLVTIQNRVYDLLQCLYNDGKDHTNLIHNLENINDILMASADPDVEN